MIDGPSAIAIALGLVAVAIAIWDNLRDRYYIWRGAVKADLVLFDIPQPNVRVDWEGRPGVVVRMTWACRNRLSWPILASFPVAFAMDGDSSDVQGILRNELFQPLGSTIFLPPRQPVDRTLWVRWPLERCGKITPTISVFHGGVPRPIEWSPRSVRWEDGRPSLNG